MTLSRSLCLARENTSWLRDRDESRSNQSRAAQLVTGSRYSHMGIVYLDDGRLFVFEAFSELQNHHPEVRAIVDQGWPNGPPLDEPVVSPAAIFESSLLVTVFEN